MQPKKISSVIIASRKPSGGVKVEHEEGEHDPMLMAAAEELVSAVHAKDAKAVVDAFCALIEAHDMHEDSESSDEEAAEHEG